MLQEPDRTRPTGTVVLQEIFIRFISNVDLYDLLLKSFMLKLTSRLPSADSQLVVAVPSYLEPLLPILISF